MNSREKNSMDKKQEVIQVYEKEYKKIGRRAIFSFVLWAIVMYPVLFISTYYSLRDSAKKSHSKV